MAIVSGIGVSPWNPYIRKTEDAPVQPERVIAVTVWEDPPIERLLLCEPDEDVNEHE